MTVERMREAWQQWLAKYPGARTSLDVAWALYKTGLKVGRPVVTLTTPCQEAHAAGYVAGYCDAMEKAGAAVGAKAERLRQVLVNAPPDDVRAGCWHVVGRLDEIERGC